MCSSDLENNTRNITDRTVILICEKYNVREEWLRSGIGEMFNKAEFVSLDTYAQSHNLTALELDIVRGYMELDPAIRKTLLEHFKAIFRKYSEETANELDIDKEVESYRQELKAEERLKTSSVLPNTDENAG